MPHSRALLLAVCCCALYLASAQAQGDALPTARLVSAPRMAMPGAVDSGVPMTWELVEGAWTLYAFASWGGVPVLMTGSAVDRMQRVGNVAFDPSPGHGIWIESVIADEGGTWYAYYHHEVPADLCGRPDRAIPRIGAARSSDRGATWEDLRDLRGASWRHFVATVTPAAYEFLQYGRWFAL